jgi:hypothetical protein
VNFLGLIAAIGIPLLNGFLATAWFLKNDKEATLLERIPLAFGLGLGFLTFEIFVLGVLEVRFSLVIITLIQAVFFISLLLNYWFVGGLTREVLFGARAQGEQSVESANGKWQKVKPFVAAALIVWIVLKALFVIDECLMRPIFSIDAWGHWASGAKFFFYERGFNLNPADWNYFGRGYRVDLGYPLHLSLAELWAAMWLGHFNEALVKVWSALYFLAISLFFFAAVRREAGRFAGLLWLFFFVSAPLMVYHGIEGLADLPLAFYAFSGVVCFWRYIKKGDLRVLSLAGLLIGMAISTKYEGLFFFFAIALALGIKLVWNREKIVISIGLFLLPVLIIVGPWLLFKSLNDLSMLHKNVEAQVSSVVKHGSMGVKETPEKEIIVAEGVERKFIRFELVDDIFRQLFMSANYNMIFAFWVVVSLVSLRKVRSSDLKYIYLIVFAVLFCFMTLYLVLVPEVVKEGTAIYRNALTYLPILYFSSALLSARLREP